MGFVRGIFDGLSELIERATRRATVAGVIAMAIVGVYLYGSVVELPTIAENLDEGFLIVLGWALVKGNGNGGE